MEAFNSQEVLKKIAVKKEGILFSKSRILDGQRLVLTGGLEDTQVLQDQSINLWTPVVDRFSPLAYALGDHVHQRISKHKGWESCYRASLGICHILQGTGLFREIGELCVRCQVVRKR